MNVALAARRSFTRAAGRQAIISPPASSSRRASATWTAPGSTRAQQGWSREPVVEMLIPSTLDDTLAPKGAHVASLFYKHVAPQLARRKDPGTTIQDLTYNPGGAVLHSCGLP